MKTTLLRGFALPALVISTILHTNALTLEDLRHEPNLTPETFARHFAHFKFLFAANVQEPESFLRAGAGDCDDYSTLAAAELSARGYRTRLVSVRLKNVAHVICYVVEANAYLDYNFRAKGGLVPCGPDLAEMADSVAKAFKSTWSSVSEFTYSERVKRLVSTTLPKNQPKRIASAK